MPPSMLSAGNFRDLIMYKRKNIKGSSNNRDSVEAILFRNLAYLKTYRTKQVRNKIGQFSKKNPSSRDST